MIEEKKADVVMMDVDVNMKDVIGGGDSMPKTSTGDGHSLIKAGAGGVTKRRTHSPIRAPETTATEKRQRKCLLAPHGGSGINVTSLVDLADYVSVQHPNEGTCLTPGTDAARSFPEIRLAN